MERTVPEVASEEIDLFIRTTYSLMRASNEVRVRSLEEAHAAMNSLLHPLARSMIVDMSAFVYSVLRLPAVISQVGLVVLGQSFETFAEFGIEGITEWAEVRAPARRRRCYFNGKDTLACLIASRSDIDDLVPILAAYQIEWNKLHRLLQRLPEGFEFSNLLNDPIRLADLSTMLGLSLDDMNRLVSIWGEDFEQVLAKVASRKADFRIRLLDSSLSEYRQAIHRWWEQISQTKPELEFRPVYFVSSNPHSIINLVTGFALSHEEELLAFLHDSKDQDLQEEWAKIQAEEVRAPRENFFYYLLKKSAGTRLGDRLKEEKSKLEAASFISRIKGEHNFDLETQLIPIADLDFEKIDPRLRGDLHPSLANSDAMIINIDYPLGLAAYQVLTEIADNVGKVLGIYIIGKAATLNGVVGDVMLPNVVYDGQSLNTYLFANCFKGQDVSPYLVFGTALDNQKAVTVQGTFLQNHEYMDVFYREGYTDIEMEAGPYLSAIYELIRPKRHPVNEVVNLYELPFDLGMLHYASDKPLSKGMNLGAASLSYFGMDPTYACGVAVLKRIFRMERERLRAV
ncbi:MAG: hypothetical protein JW757_04010 [Anaerolineales bacterium]|nr:hypothetical protein [Anaerolineales bacterium]